LEEEQTLFLKMGPPLSFSRLAYGLSQPERQIRRFWLRQNDEQKQAKTNTEILAAPE